MSSTLAVLSFRLVYKAPVELCVVVTTTLLLGMFAMVCIAPWFFFTRRLVAPVAPLMSMFMNNLVSYTLGFMPSPTNGGGAVNDLSQVWAVLIVTMQDSALMGVPHRAKKMTLVDLLCSLWSANQLILAQTRLRLKLPLWFIWSVHALRVIWYHVSSYHAAEACRGNIKLVSDYMMTWQHTDDDASPATMRGYRYIVVGEEEQRTELRQPGFTLEMDLTRPGSTQLLTVDKVWNQESSDGLLSTAADSDSRFKDVCLSFALYKLQRRRFFDFPIAEAAHPATRRLVSEAILEEGANGSYERALRITEVELSFLHDSFYSTHAVVFAGGFPYVRLLLSALMAVSVMYLLYPVGDIPNNGAAVIGKKSQQFTIITHGVLITHYTIAAVVCRELIEAAIYVFSQWTKVRIICHYIKLKLQRPSRGRVAAMVVTEKLARIMFRVIGRGHWDQRIVQYNLLMAMLPGTKRPALARFYTSWRHDIRAVIPRRVKLQSEVKRALFQSLKNLIDNVPDPSSHHTEGNPSAGSSCTQQQMNSLLMSYFRNAFVDDADDRSSPPLIEDTTAELWSETHKILVWHIATSLCHIKLLEEAGQPPAGIDLYTYNLPGKTPLSGDLAAAWPHHVTAISLSNYCAYLVTKALVPDNGLIARRVLGAVRDEVRDALLGCTTVREIPHRLSSLTGDGERSTMIVVMGARLSKKLMLAYTGRADLWERLARFWAGFLLHLSASTRSAKHKIYLQGGGELTTHLWLLLSHAGFLGKTIHGEQLLDPVDLYNA